MKFRALLTFTAIVSSILGGVAVYLLLSVPNDLKADAMMKAARKNLEAGKRDVARSELSGIVQHYPRTDAAAAATIALITLGDQDRRQLEAEITRLRDENAQHTQSLSSLEQSVDTIKNTPPPAPKIIVEKAPAPKPAAKKKTTRSHRRHRR